MLSEQTKSLVKATIPVLKQYGDAITSRFYELLFENHPELRNVFNQSNQQLGKQQKALAMAILAAAEHIDQLESILPVVGQIGEKHRSLGVQPEHYPIVGKFLLAAIKDVLGDAATPEILAAWGEAYGVIADVFIQMEKSMYDNAKNQVGGWEGFRKFRVTKKIRESDEITSFYLEPVDGEPLAMFVPGQYITVQVQPADSKYTHMRQYSLSDAPNGTYYRISVKREAGGPNKPDGVVSTYLHTRIGAGDIVLLSAPAGDFVLDLENSSPLVLIAGGVGLTPLISMLNTVLKVQPGRPVTFIQAARHGGVHGMKSHVQKLCEEHNQLRSLVCYEQPLEEDVLYEDYQHMGFLNKDWFESLELPQNAVYYFCGPTPFMAAVSQCLSQLNVKAENIHFEFFGPMQELTPATPVLS